MFKKELKFVKKIQKGDKAAWDTFVERFSDLAFTCAIKITKRKRWHPNQETLQFTAKNGKRYTYTEDAHDAYLWFLKHVKDNLHKYSGLVPLQDFVCLWINNAWHTKLDYLKWRFKNAEYIPAVITKDHPQDIQRIFRMLQKRKTEEDIARTLGIDSEKAFELVSEVIHIAMCEDLYRLLKTSEPPTDLSKGVYPDKKEFAEKWMFDDFMQKYSRAVCGLTEEEKLLIQILSEERSNSDLILSMFQNTGKCLPGVKPEKMKIADRNSVFRATEKTKNHLKNLLCTECSDWGIPQIDTKTVTMLIEELGVISND